jgi:hypothetical protein
MWRRQRSKGKGQKRGRTWRRNLPFDLCPLPFDLERSEASDTNLTENIQTFIINA